MYSTNTISTSESSGVEKTNETSVQSKSTNTRRRAHIKMVQNILLIWLDNTIVENNQDSHNTVTQLRRVVNDISTFTDSDECIQFINTINDNKVCMIIS
jgi:hypothetical protein